MQVRCVIQFYKKLSKHIICPLRRNHNEEKNTILIIITLTLLWLVVFGIFIKNKNEEKRSLEISNAYRNVNSVGHGTIDDYYIPFYPSTSTIDGIQSGQYLYIEYYRQQTGAEFYYEDMVEYFSQEYEEDGSLRLYNNGLHPEMEAYVDWVNIYYEDAREYIQKIDTIFGSYFFAHREEGFENSALHTWSRATLDELIKKEADPTYEMDLMSIQQMERAETEEQSIE